MKRPPNAERVALLRSWRRPVSWSGAPGPLAARFRAEWTPRFAREGVLYRGAGLLARWPRNFARGGDVSLRSRRRRVSWSGAPGPLAAQLHAEWTSRCARKGGPEDRPTYSAPRTHCTASLRSRRRPLSWSGAPGPLSARLREGLTSRCAREGGPTDRPTYSAPRTVLGYSRRGTSRNFSLR